MVALPPSLGRKSVSTLPEPTVLKPAPYSPVRERANRSGHAASLREICSDRVVARASRVALARRTRTREALACARRWHAQGIHEAKTHAHRGARRVRACCHDVTRSHLPYARQRALRMRASSHVTHGEACRHALFTRARMLLRTCGCVRAFILANL
eukprot:2029493-Pleurochrysis_carterae.AAC.4